MVGATHRLSMLKPLPLNSPTTLESTPGWLSTSIVIMCFCSFIKFSSLRVASYVLLWRKEHSAQTDKSDSSETSTLCSMRFALCFEIRNRKSQIEKPAPRTPQRGTRLNQQHIRYG